MRFLVEILHAKIQRVGTTGFPSFDVDEKYVQIQHDQFLKFGEGRETES